jgi:hypothetical protein
VAIFAKVVKPYRQMKSKYGEHDFSFRRQKAGGFISQSLHHNRKDPAAASPNIKSFKVWFCGSNCQSLSAVILECIGISGWEKMKGGGGLIF